jgi:molybdenum cofactor biosynthesis protein B
MDLPVPVNVAMVGVGADEAAVKIVHERLDALGHQFIDVQQRTGSDPLLELLTTWVENPEIDVVLAIANDIDPVRAALEPLVSRSIPGFGELLRLTAFSEIGSSAMTLDAEAARCGTTYVFVIPGTVGAVKVALDQLLIPQLDTRTRPTSLATRLPRLRSAPPPDAFSSRESTDIGAPPPPKAPAAAPSRTSPPGPPPRPSKTPPLGVVLRPPADVDVPLLSSDAAIPILPALIVDDPPPRPHPETLEVDNAAINSEIAVPRTRTDEVEPEQIVPEKPSAQALTSDNVGEFVRSLKQHAKDARERSQVVPLPTKPKTEPPPLPKKTDAELKAARDAAVSEAISHVGPRPESPSQPAEPPEPTEAPPEAAPAPRKKNITTPQQWAHATNAVQKLAARPSEPTLGELQSRDRATAVSGKKRHGALMIPALLGVAAASVYVGKTQLGSQSTASAEPHAQPVESPPPIQLAASAQPAQGSQGPEIVVDLSGSAQGPSAAPAGSNAVNLTALAQTHHHTTAPHASSGSDATGSDATGSDTTDGPADPRTHPNVAPETPDCDEASCILEKYARACCARYKPAEMPVDKVEPKPSGPAETLDKAAVKAGITDVKPAVQECGEEHYHSGTVKITLTVSADGVVTDTTVAESPDPALGACVASALKRATFAKTQNGAVFTYPFAF